MDLDQDFFWNAAVSGRWSGTPESLLERLLMVESGQGRERHRNRPKGPRILDLDLLLCGQELRASARLTVPHPGLWDRRFALAPLVELAPDATDPRTGRRWAEGLAGVASQPVDRTDQTW
jgi:2-amino-4-hydroxy-6-hydroxymethyldihydropteridine diphosphokinase